MAGEAKSRLIVALDVGIAEEALEICGQLEGIVDYYKIGLQLFCSAGPQLVREVRARGAEVFLDLKLYDIPNTVEQAGRVLTRLGVSMLTVHAAGGRKMLSQLAAGIEDEARLTGGRRPLIIAITVLTSAGGIEVAPPDFQGDRVSDLVVHWARLAKEAGADGVTASAQEAPLVHQSCGREFRVVTPGIRPSWAATNDQVRIVTPGEAVAQGSDFLVVGRPILGAADRREAARRILEEMEG